MANRNWSNGGKIYSMHTMPVLLDCNFVVAPASAAGITSLKGPAISNVFMHTSATPAPGNPNPAIGTIVVQLADNYSQYLTGFNIVSPALSGTPILVIASGSALTVGAAYVITFLGSTTIASWQKLGVPAGVTPAIGVSFVAALTGVGSGSGAVQVAASTGSSIATIEILGDPSLSIAPNPGASQGFGSQFILQCRDFTGALVAPTPGSRISLSFLLSNSSIKVQGE